MSALEKAAQHLASARMIHNLPEARQFSRARRAQMQIRELTAAVGLLIRHIRQREATK